MVDGVARTLVGNGSDALAILARALGRARERPEEIGRSALVGVAAVAVAPLRDDAGRLPARALGRAAEDVLVDVLDPQPLVGRGVLDRDRDQRQSVRLIGLHVLPAPEQVGKERLRARVTVLAQNRQPVLAERNVGLEPLALELELGAARTARPGR